VTYLLVAILSSSATATVLLSAVYLLRNRLVRRLKAARQLAETQRDLENRRVAYDSGREYLARATAGRTGRVLDGMAVRPGTLARYLRDR